MRYFFLSWGNKMNTYYRLSMVITIIAALAVGFVDPATIKASPQTSITDNLSINYPFDESTGSADRVPAFGSTHLVANTSITATTGIINNGINLSSGSYLSATSSSEIQIGSSDYTISFWINPSSTQSTYTPQIFQKMIANTDFDYDAYLYGGSIYHRAGGCSVSTAYTADEWNFVVLQRTGGVIKISNNNSAFQTASCPTSPTADSSPLFVGLNWEFLYPFNGVIDEFSIWKRAIDNDERTSIYNSGIGCAYAFSSCTSTTTYLEFIKQTDALAKYPLIRGTGQTVVIVDSGIDASLPKFANKIVYQYDYVNNDTTADDVDGHGTAVASIIVDVCPDCKLVVLKTIGTTLIDVPLIYPRNESALQWVVTNQQAYNIVSVNMSQGNQDLYNLSQNVSMFHDEIGQLYALGVAVVAAAGNEFYSPHLSQTGATYPASDTYVIGVGAQFFKNSGSYSDGSGASASTSGAGRIAPFSDRHPALVPIFAAGVDIPVVDLGSGTTLFNGTSAASPQVAATIALIQDKAVKVRGAKYNVAQLKQILVSSAHLMFDGDDEDDNVTNTQTNYSQLDVLAALDNTRVLGNVLKDGSFESNDAAWRVEQTDLSGRIDTGNPINWLAYGTAQCGQYVYTVGSSGYPISRFLSGEYSTVYQQFNWQGGTMYYKYSAKNPNGSEGTSVGSSAFYTLKLFKVEDDSLAYIADNEEIDHRVWHDYSGTVADLSPGTYRLYIERGDDGDSLATDVIEIDNIYLSDGVITARPCDDTINLFPTATPGFTPTPQVLPVANCSFESDTLGWTIKAPAEIRTAGGAALGSKYAYNPEDGENLKQYVLVQSPSNTLLHRVYIQFYYKGSPEVVLKSVDGLNNRITVFSTSQRNATPPVATDWTFWSGVVPTPASGGYMLTFGAAKAYMADNIGVFNDNSFINYPASFDGVMVSVNAPSAVGCGNSTPTATPTGMATRTPTPPYYSTWTPAPRMTFTPRPSPTPSLNDLGTPIPPTVGEIPGLPNNGNECKMPEDQKQYLTFTNWWQYLTQIPEMVNYARCNFIWYFRWNNFNTYQVSTINASFLAYEPFASIMQFSIMLNQIKDVILTTDYGNAAPCDGTILNMMPRGAVEWFNGTAKFEPQTNDIALTCAIHFEDILGADVNRGVCWGYNVLCKYGIIQLFRWIVVLVSAALVWEYIQVVWMEQAQT